MLFRDKNVSFETPKIMGILNVTPDSFSDGNVFMAKDDAIRHAQQMVVEGASFIDVGGESTKPGAAIVSTDEELERVIPVIEKLAKSIDVVISVDTSKAEVMQEAVNAGAGLINDVRALQLPNAMNVAVLAAKMHNVPSCIMHMQGSPQTMQNSPVYEDVIHQVSLFFKQRIEACLTAGFTHEQLLLDPGFGFGKTLDHNYQLLKQLTVLSHFKLPLLVGMSRKSMIGDLLNRATNERLSGSIAAALIASMNGASILRVHDVKETADAVNVYNKVQSTELIFRG